MTAAEYLAHKYELPKKFPELPLADEKFISAWSVKENFKVLAFLSQEFELPTEKFDWKNIAALKIEFKQTLGGRLPVISTANHDDFCQMVALMTARELKKYPPTVNAFTIPCRAEKIGLNVEDWLKKSYQIRLRHESAHYETLRLLGGMKNHALDEILADCLGQMAAFGEFSAKRQRIFFGVELRFEVKQNEIFQCTSLVEGKYCRQ